MFLKNIRNESDTALTELITSIGTAVDLSVSNSITVQFGTTQIQYTDVATVVSYLQDAQFTLTTSTVDFKKLLEEWRLFLEEFPPEGLSLKYGNINGY
jgi:hypothetical protein